MTNGKGIAVVRRHGIDAQRLRSLRLAIKAKAPVASGKLKRSWNDPRTVQVIDGKIEIDNPLPYARIQDQGGTIPPYNIIDAKGPGHVMRAVIGGQVRYFTKRGEIEIKAQNYVSEAIAEWKKTSIGKDVMKRKDMDVGWAPESGGAISESLRASVNAIRLKQAAEAQRLNAQAATGL